MQPSAPDIASVRGAAGLLHGVSPMAGGPPYWLSADGKVAWHSSKRDFPNGTRRNYGDGGSFRAIQEDDPCRSLISLQHAPRRAAPSRRSLSHSARLR